MDYLESKRVYGDSLPPPEHRVPGVYIAKGKDKWFYQHYDPSRKALGKNPRVNKVVGTYWETADALMQLRGLPFKLDDEPAVLFATTHGGAPVRSGHQARASGRQVDLSIAELLGQYELRGKPSEAEVGTMRAMAKTIKGSVKDISIKWATEFVADLKKTGLKPSTIKKKIEALARAYEWHLRTIALAQAARLGGGAAIEEECLRKLPRNPLRMLEAGYADYTASEVAQFGLAEMPKDVTRDRRLFPGELEAICAVAMGTAKTAKGKVWEPWHRTATPVERTAIQTLLIGLVETACRLSELSAMRWYQVNFSGRTLVLPPEVTKTDTGRMVPMKPVVLKLLRDWLAVCKGHGFDVGPTAPVFPMFAQAERGTRAARLENGRVSSLLNKLVDACGLLDLRIHDLRHEGVCRWVELKVAGRWAYKKEEVMKIVGHRTEEMFFRYLSLRGSDLADVLYEDDVSANDAPAIVVEAPLPQLAAA